MFVDCLFGSGLARPLGDELADAAARALPPRITTRVAVDLPSGVASDNGALLNEGLPRLRPDHRARRVEVRRTGCCRPRAMMGERSWCGIGVEPVDGAARGHRASALVRSRCRCAQIYAAACSRVVDGADAGCCGAGACAAAMHAGAGYVKLFGNGDARAADGSSPTRGRWPKRWTTIASAALLVGPGLARDDSAQRAAGGRAGARLADAWSTPMRWTCSSRPCSRDARHRWS